MPKELFENPKKSFNFSERNSVYFPQSISIAGLIDTRLFVVILLGSNKSQSHWYLMQSIYEFFSESNPSEVVLGTFSFFLIKVSDRCLMVSVLLVCMKV